MRRQKGYTKIVELILSYTSSPPRTLAISKNGDTALSLAKYNNHPDIVEIINTYTLQYRNQPNSQRNSQYYRIVGGMDDKTVTLDENTGIDWENKPDVNDVSHGSCVIDERILFDDEIEELITNIETKNDNDEDIYDMVNNKNIKKYINCPDNNGNIPLKLAVTKNKPNIVLVLLEHGKSTQHRHYSD